MEVTINRGAKALQVAVTFFGIKITNLSGKGFDAVGTRVDNTTLFIIKKYSVIYRLRS